MKKPLAVTGGFRLGGLPYFHPLPAQKAVNVVYEECGKAHHDADIHGIFHTRHDPQHYQHDVVCRICEGEIGASSEREIRGDKAGRDGDCAGDDDGGFEVY